MPLYEYQCLQCGRRIEALHRFADPPLTVCETCGGELKRLVSAPSFQFKGTGWYVTDYAKSGSGGGQDTGDKASEGDKGYRGDKAGKSGGTDTPAGGGDGASGAKADSEAKPSASPAPSPSGTPSKSST